MNFSLSIFSALRALLLICGAALLSSPLQAAPVRIITFGGVMTAGEDLAPAERFCAQLESALKRRGYDITVDDQSRTVDTSQDALMRLDALVAAKPDIVVVVLGLNDALNNVAVDETRQNLDALLFRLRNEHIRVVLAGLLAPLSLGKEYGAAFNAIYPDIANSNESTLYPYFLEGVASQRHLLMPDGLRPNADGVNAIVQNMLSYIAPVVEDRIYARVAKSQRQNLRPKRRK